MLKFSKIHAFHIIENGSFKLINPKILTFPGFLEFYVQLAIHSRTFRSYILLKNCHKVHARITV